MELPVGACTDPLPLECGITVIRAYKLDVSVTIKMLERQEKYRRPAEETLEMIKRQFVASDSIDVTDVKVPLTCPVCRSRTVRSDPRLLSLVVDQKATGDPLLRSQLPAFILFRRQSIRGDEQ